MKLRAWKTFHSWTGDSICYFLLTQCLLFVPIEQFDSEGNKLLLGNYIQVCGVPLSEYVAKQPNSVPLRSHQTPRTLKNTKKKPDKPKESNITSKRKRPSRRKRQKKAKQTSPFIEMESAGGKEDQATKVPKEPVLPQSNAGINWYAVILPRIQIFYKNPRAVHRDILPRGHWLNQEPTTRNAYLFWRCIFKSEANQGNKRNPGSRATVAAALNVKLERKKLKPNMKPVLECLQRAMKYHQRRIAYNSLLAYHCPLTQEAQKSIKIAYHLSQTQDLRNQKLNYNLFTKHYTPYRNVSQFIMSILRKIFRPMKLIFGSDNNIRRLQSKVEEFIALKRRDSISVGKLMEGIKLSECKWLNTTSYGGKTYQEYQRRMMGRVLLWIFRSLIIPLIGNFFYCTESAPHFNKIFYFRKPLWNSIDNLAAFQLIDSMLEPISREQAQQIIAKRDFGYSHVRMLPKNHGVRPILNLGKKRVQKSSETSVRCFCFMVLLIDVKSE